MATQTLHVGVLVGRWRHRLAGIVAIGLAATALGCSREETSTPTEKISRYTEALSAITIRTYGFESLSDWSPYSSSPTLSLSTTHVEGLRSLSVAGGGWSSVISRILVKEDPAPTTVGFDLRIPSPQPNPDWFGNVQLFVSIPSQGINNLPLGLHDLIQWTPGQFRRAEFSLPANVQTALNTNFNDLRWRIELNRPFNATAGYLFDRFTYGPLCTPQSDNNPCTTDTCNAQGQQVHTPVPAGTSCADSSACNGAETCNAQASCVAGTPVTCTASDQCHDAGTCNPATGACSNPQKQNGTTCNDASACTQTDTCQAGTCTGGSPVVCVASDQCHDPGTCNPANGACSNPAKPNGATCSDANACTQTDTCQAGACTGASPVVCVASDSCHDPGTCSPGTGICSNPARPNGTACNDATVCNGSETCQGGSCTPGNPPTTDDGNPCTTDACDAVAGVTHTPVTAGTSCADTDACDGSEVCDASGVCGNGTPVVCAASDQCHEIGACNPSTGVCSNPAKPDGATCSDADACTQADSCQAGTCTGSNPVVCTASDQCHDAGTCASETGLCSNPAKPNGSACSDADACTQSDSCQAGTCAGSNPVVCAASDLCHDAGTCDPSTGACSNPEKPDGTSCPDGTVCNGAETCSSGACTSGTPLVTDDGNPCTADACDPITGVSHTPVSAGTTCSNGNACDGSELCNGTGTCVAGTPPEFDDGNPCTADACDPMGGVTHTPSPVGTHCGDENLCNGNETCDGAGTCVPGTPPELDDDNPCTADTCDPFQGAVHTPAPSGTSCSDLDFCNGSELCDAAGACQPGTPVSTEDGNACTSGTCDPLTGTVTQSPLPTGTECFIDRCTLGECNATGECGAAGSTVVDDGDPCTVEWCDPVLGPQMKRCSDIDPTIGTTLHQSMKWIYEQPNPPQIGVAPGTIEVARASALRGIVRTRDGDPLPGVTVAIQDHPEFGYTLTHADGYFDMVINGGGAEVLRLEKEGYLGVRRRMETTWGQFASVTDVVMIPPDPTVTPIDLTAPSEEFQVARGTEQADVDGTRQGTLLIPAGTDAVMHLEGGGTEPLGSMNVRITEFTVGPSGPAAMPAPLPPQNEYTYAFEVNADEAVESGASSVTFSSPLIYYVDNFLGFPAGTSVPLGAYDRDAAQWLAADSGIVLALTEETDGVAQIDVTGDGLAESGTELDDLGISEVERSKLAELYEPGQSLWRVLIPHFTTPWDCNWGVIPPEDAIPPNGLGPTSDDTGRCPSSVAGASTIDCEPQVLRESIPIAGTPYSLNYSSARVRGRTAAYRFEIQLTGTSIPPSLDTVYLAVIVGGRRTVQQFPAGANMLGSFEWDGLDAHGRRVQGSQRASVNVSFAYDAEYAAGKSWGSPGNGVALFGDRARNQILFDRGYSVDLGVFDAGATGLGAWTLSVNHVHELVARRLQHGGGGMMNVEGIPAVASILLRRSLGVNQIAVAPDGRIFFGGPGNVFLADDEVVTTFAGNGELGHAGDGLPATHPDVRLGRNRDLALGRDGSLYIAENENQVVRLIDPGGIVRTFAGVGGVRGHAGDGGQATQALLRDPTAIAIDGGDSLFVAERAAIRRVSPDGTIATIAGQDDSGATPPLPDDGSIAAEVPLRPYLLAVSPAGTLFAAIETSSGRRIIRFVDGLIYHVAGNDCVGIGCGPTEVDGLPAKETTISPTSLTFDRDGRLVFTDVPGNSPAVLRPVRVLATGDVVRTIASAGLGNGTLTQPDGAPAYGVRVAAQDVVLGPDGLYVTGFVSGGDLIYRIDEPFPGDTGTSFVIGSAEQQAFYDFDALGRHLATRHSLTGASLSTFGYTATGQLATVTDESAKSTTVERDASGNPTAIVSPFGMRTVLELDPNGYLANVVDPEGNSTRMTYSHDGLLQSVTNARDVTSTMNYDSLGRLHRDADVLGGEHVLTRSQQFGRLDWSVTRTTALGRSTTYETVNRKASNESRIITSPAGTQTVSTLGLDQTTSVLSADGTTTTTTTTADQRLGLQDPIVSRETTLPSGITSTESSTREYTFLNPLDLLDFNTVTDRRVVNGRIWNTIFAKPTRTFTTLSPLGRQTFRVIDPQGRTTRTEVSGILPTDFVYDSSGRLQSVTQGGRTTTNAYFPSGTTAGYLSSITDATSIATDFTRDALGRTLTETRSTATTSFDWDEVSNLASVTPPGKPTHDMTYTPVNLLETYEPPPAGLPASATSYTYDPDRMLRTETRPGGVSIVRTPDSAGRLDTVAIPGGLIDYDYFPPSAPSGAGRTSDIRGPYGVDLSFTYDGSLTTSTSWSGDVTGSVAWQYNNDFQKILETVSGATGTAQTVFGYDLDQLLTCASPTTCSPPGADALTLARHPQHGMVTQITLGSTTENWTYNGFGELARQTASFGGAALVDITYDEAGFERDALGRITRKTETILGVTKTYEYRYDALRRLDQVKIDGVVEEEFTYDANGNRLTAFKAGVGTLSATYDDQDRLLTYGTWVFTYTANGELETKTDTATGETWLFQYDALGNLISVGLPNGDLVEYLVDGMGRRVGKKKNGVLLKQWIYRDRLKPVAEFDGGGNLVSVFAFAVKAGVPEYVVRAGVTYRVVTDQLGSPRFAVNMADAGDVPFRAEYTNFGEITGTGLDWMPFGFVGGMYDAEAGLVHIGARDLDPLFGRWTAKDPVRFEGGQANVYPYAANDPINNLDPNGREVLPGAAAAAAGVAAADGPLPFGDAVGLGILACAFLIDVVNEEEERKKRCYAGYLSDTAYCGETWPDDHRYNICMNNAWRRYVLCLNGLPPDGPLVPR